jgi:hypothetical protein
MAVVVEQEQLAMIAAELGALGDVQALTQLRQAWRLYEDRALVHPRLRYLYTLKHGLRVLLGQTWLNRDWTDQDQVKELASQPHSHLINQLKQVQIEIDSLELLSRANRAPVVGRLTAEAPLEPDPGQPNPNDRGYRGDPLIVSTVISRG